MTSVQIIGKSLFSMSLAAAGWFVQAAPAPKPPAGPPPIEVPFDRLEPEAAFDVTDLTGLAATADAVWLVRSAGLATRVDVEKNAAAEPIAIDGLPCGGLASAFDAIWVPRCDPPGLVRADPKSAKVVAAPGYGISSGAGAIATGTGSIWLLTDAGTVARIDPGTNAIVAEVYVAAGASDLVFHDDAIWVASGTGKRVTKINAHTNVVDKAIDVAAGPRRLAAGEGAIWSLNADGGVSRIDQGGSRVVATIEVGAGAAGGWIAAGEGSVWVSAPAAPLVRIDPRTNRVVHRLTGEGGGPVVVGHRSLWLASSGRVLRVDPRFVEALR